TFRPGDSFFDIGGNSISAQYMLAAVKKRLPEVNVDIVTIIRNPNLRAFAAEVDRSLDPIGLRLDVNGQANGMPQERAYSTDVDESFEKELQWTYPSTEPDLSHGATIFLTGVTGFLGAYILKDLLSRVNTHVIAHVRAPTEAAGFKRIRETCQAYGIWSDDWSKRLSCVVGDLAKPNLGLNTEAWEKVANEADIVIHNGARVHWVLPFANQLTYLSLTDDALKPTNVLSTIAAMSLCRNPSKPKFFCFISSTSVLDTDHYIQLCSSGTPVPENDELEGSRKGLGTGYGQSKWVSEYLVREAGKRGLKGCIPITAKDVTNTDDFLVRHVKGCIQLGSAPIIPNNINMVPVNHVARCVVACAFHPPSSSSNVNVAQVTANPRLTFTQFTDVLRVHGYGVDSIPYEEWKRKLVGYVEQQQQQGGQEAKEEHALMPLYHFVTGSSLFSFLSAPYFSFRTISTTHSLPVSLSSLTPPLSTLAPRIHPSIHPNPHLTSTGDLPTTTRAPLLSDTNTQAALLADSAATTNTSSSHRSITSSPYPSVTPEVVGLYIAYLVRIGFLPPPPKDGKGKALPEVDVDVGFGGLGLKGRGRG
ncbi:MAG: hypothetical protein Q9192_008106, partial [Flavoplaca navasiana]